MITPLKTFTFAALAAALVSTASAQISPPLPSGVETFMPDPANAANYFTAFNPGTPMTNLYFDSALNVPSVIQSASWSNGPINLSTLFGGNPWKPEGGSVKTIYLGETAGWKDDFGYVSTISPSTLVPLATGILSNNIPVTGGNVVSGWSTTVNYAAGASLDFWLNSGGDIGQGGTFFAFGMPNQNAGGDTSNHVRWSMQDVPTTYFNGITTVTAPVKTLIVGFEDTRQGISFYDGDFNDIVVAFQFLPTQTPPVPEPSTYGLLGGIALLGMVAVRRFKRKAA